MWGSTAGRRTDTGDAVQKDKSVDCVAKVLSEIKEDGAESVGTMTDHGHRSGQDHFGVVGNGEFCMVIEYSHHMILTFIL